MSDPGTSYRTRDEVQEVRQTRDPITSFKEKIISSNLVTTEEIKVISFLKPCKIFLMKEIHKFLSENCINLFTLEYF